LVLSAYMTRYCVEGRKVLSALCIILGEEGRRCDAPDLCEGHETTQDPSMGDLLCSAKQLEAALRRAGVSQGHVSQVRGLMMADHGLIAAEDLKQRGTKVVSAIRFLRASRRTQRAHNVPTETVGVDLEHVTDCAAQEHTTFAAMSARESDDSSNLGGQPDDEKQIDGASSEGCAAASAVSDAPAPAHTV